MHTGRVSSYAADRLVGFTLLSTLCYYTFFSALTPFATKSRGADATDVFLALSIATALFVALQYPMGALSDRRGRRPRAGACLHPPAGRCGIKTQPRRWPKRSALVAR